jgi:hypothetical protein
VRDFCENTGELSAFLSAGIGGMLCVAMIGYGWSYPLVILIMAVYDFQERSRLKNSRPASLQIISDDLASLHNKFDALKLGNIL